MYGKVLKAEYTWLNVATAMWLYVSDKQCAANATPHVFILSFQVGFLVFFKVVLGNSSQGILIFYGFSAFSTHSQLSCCT